MSPPNAGVSIPLGCGERWRRLSAGVGKGARTGPLALAYSSRWSVRDAGMGGR